MRIFHQRYIYILISIFILFDVQAQKTDSINFRSPLDIPILLAANFGELRPNHFHGGLDVKTQQVVGKPLYAIDSGFIVRIQVRPVGYGRAVYIQHPNGYTSVYGHILKFAPRVDSIITAYQIQQRKHEVDIEFTAGEIPLERGEVFAYTGNAGSSGGPHLHFEIRNTASLYAHNPFKFYPDLTDKKAPRIYTLTAYPLDSLSFVENKDEMQIYKPYEVGGGVYKISKPIHAKGQVGFGVRANDYMHNVHNVFGVNEVELRCNDSVIYARSLDSISFAENFDINSLIDYDLYMSSRKYIEKLFVEPNNQLSIYTVKNYGIPVDSVHKEYACELRTIDFHNNKAMLKFSVEYDSLSVDSLNAINAKLQNKWNENKVFVQDSITILADSASFFKDYSFEIVTDSIWSGRYYSQKYEIKSSEYVVRKPVEIQIQSRLPDSLRSKGLIQFEPPRGYKRALLATIDENGVAYGETKKLGTFSVVIDTISPTIKSLNFSEGENISSKENISFKMYDNFSGVDQYFAYIDGLWCILYYDAKYAFVTLDISKADIEKNKKHTLEIVLIDGVGNRTSLIRNFYW